MSKPLKINELTSQLFEQKRIKNNILQAQVQNTWEKLMGNNVIKRTNKIFIKENKLIIKLTSAPLKNELNNSKKRIIKQINEIHSEIQELIFI
jgi:hypothetical protein|tara:strand:- start:52 stop:330 length:279 start_codon:yes stop_codon:yes gene_type:complete